mmetsp:Transcript_36289/g.107145  ORF Transcript_36289/g.107145 Transcript_36289/m.107145 type:complete len:348 (+) Transcript_36289:8-1051(+)
MQRSNSLHHTNLMRVHMASSWFNLPARFAHMQCSPKRLLGSGRIGPRAQKPWKQCSYLGRPRSWRNRWPPALAVRASTSSHTAATGTGATAAPPLPTQPTPALASHSLPVCTCSADCHVCRQDGTIVVPKCSVPGAAQSPQPPPSPSLLLPAPLPTVSAAAGGGGAGAEPVRVRAPAPATVAGTLLLAHGCSGRHGWLGWECVTHACSPPAGHALGVGCGGNGWLAPGRPSLRGRMRTERQNAIMKVTRRPPGSGLGPCPGTTPCSTDPSNMVNRPTFGCTIQPRVASAGAPNAWSVTSVGPPMPPPLRYNTHEMTGLLTCPIPSLSESKCIWWPQPCGRQCAHHSA